MNDSAETCAHCLDGVPVEIVDGRPACEACAWPLHVADALHTSAPALEHDELAEAS